MKPSSSKFTSDRNCSIDPPRAGSGNAAIPAVRRNPRRRILDHSPTCAVNFDRLPFPIANVDIEFSTELGGAQMDLVPRALEFRMRA